MTEAGSTFAVQKAMELDEDLAALELCWLVLVVREYDLAMAGS